MPTHDSVRNPRLQSGRIKKIEVWCGPCVGPNAVRHLSAERVQSEAIAALAAPSVGTGEGKDKP